MPNNFEHEMRVLSNGIGSIIDIDNLECYVKCKPTNQSCSHTKYSHSINLQMISINVGLISTNVGLILINVGLESAWWCDVWVIFDKRGGWNNIVVGGKFSEY